MRGNELFWKRTDRQRGREKLLRKSLDTVMLRCEAKQPV